MGHASLPLMADDLERTLLPLERATQLPPAAFTDPAVLEWEIENIFRKNWVCACHIDQVSERGQFVMVETRRRQRHGDRRRRRPPARVPQPLPPPRRAASSTRPRARVPRLQCPYHAWTYGFDGSLKNAPFTDELEDFDPACIGLQPVRLAVVDGLVLLDLSGEAPPPAEHVGDLAAQLAHYRSGELQRGARIVYDVEANWKAIAENYSECLHCPGVHPELNRLSHYLSGESILGAGAWCGGSMTLSDDAETMARGRRHEPPPADRRPDRAAASASVCTSSSSRTRSSRCTPTT